MARSTSASRSEELDTHADMSPHAKGWMISRIWRRLSIAVLLWSGMVSIPANAQDDALLREAALLNQQVVELHGKGAYVPAIELAERALELGEKALGPVDPGVATLLDNLAALYSATGAFTKAEPLYQRALTIREQAIGAEHPLTASSLNNLAELYFNLGAYQKSEPLHQRALAIREKVRGPEHLETAASLNNLAMLQTAVGAYTKAEALLQRALQIMEKVQGPAHPITATALNNLGEFYRTTGAYTTAELLFQRSLTIRESALGTEHLETAASYNNLALLHTVRGSYTKAETLYQRALAIHERALGPEHPMTANSLSNLAEVYRLTGAYAKAEPLHQRALGIREQVLGAEHPQTAISLNNLALLHHDTNAYGKAEALYQRALAANEKVFGTKHPTVAASLDNLAGLYNNKGAYRDAERLYRRALAIREQALGSSHPETATSLNNLAELFHTKGADTKAESFYRRAIAIKEATLGPEHPEVATVQQNLAVLFTAKRAYARAESLYERVQEAHERNAVLFLLTGSEARKLQYLQHQAHRVSADVSLSRIHGTARSTRLGLSSVLQHKGRVLDATSDSIARLRRSLEPEDRTLLDRLAGVAQELSNLTYGVAADLSAATYRARVDLLAQQRDQLQEQLAARSAEFEQNVVPITVDEVVRTLPADAALLEWFRYRPFQIEQGSTGWGPARYMAYVLKRSGEPVAVDVGEAQPIEALITAFRGALFDPSGLSRGASRGDASRPELRTLAAELSEKLIEPLRPYLAEQQRLLVSPDGALNLVPFGALLDERGQYLVQRFEISYLTSGRDLLRMRTDAPARGSAVVLADPDYGSASTTETASLGTAPAVRSAALDRSGLVFDALPGTLAEARALQTLLELDARHVLTRERASEAQLRALQGPRILHLATHGFFLEDEDFSAVFRHPLGSTDTSTLPLGENPLLRSGLALAGANARQAGGTDDGILTAAEVAQLDLLGTQLVVLSACETALGTVDAGEGVYGLRRALVLAGAQSQLVSMWKVDDAATRSLMVRYYQQLLEGAGRASALRIVQLEMLADPARQHPYYWAAFIPIGNWKPLSH